MAILSRNRFEFPVLWLGTAERISAIVEMNHPGVWVMGDLDDDDRRHGMGIVVEYAGNKGKPQWLPPHPFKWNYAHFGNASPKFQPSPTKSSTCSSKNKTPPSTDSINGPSTASPIPGIK